MAVGVPENSPVGSSVMPWIFPDTSEYVGLGMLVDVKIPEYGSSICPVVGIPEISKAMTFKM